MIMSQNSEGRSKSSSSNFTSNSFACSTTNSSTGTRLPPLLSARSMNYAGASDRRRRDGKRPLARSITLMSIHEGGIVAAKRHHLKRRLTALDTDSNGSYKGTSSAGKTMSRRRTGQSLVEEDKKAGPTPFERFKLKANAVRWLCMVCLVYMREASERALKGTLLEVVEEILTSAEDEAKRSGNDGTFPKGLISSAYPDMTFDAAEYQRFSKREEGLPNKIKEILRLDEEDRTPEKIQNVIRNMQSIEEFAKYPPEIQKRMCKYAWYDVFTRNRVIIRDQERAEGMYFILSGKVTKTSAGQTYILKKGDKFGELDLINNTNRSCTVMSKDTVELFCIHSEDYPEIFDTKLNVKPEDCLAYLKTLPVFKPWGGHDKLLEHPAFWGVQNYRPGQVIVPDSINNEWLYIIKSGTCDVLKQLTSGVCMRDKSGKYAKEYKKAESAKEIEQMHRQMAAKLPSHMRATFLTTPGTYSARSGRSPRDREPISGVPEDAIARRKMSSQSAASTLHSLSIEQCVRKGSGLDTPSCVRVGELEAGDIFDILTVMPGYKQDKCERVSLVSQGAEAIKISKSFFLKFADERVFTEIEMRYEPYPDQDACLKDLDVTSHWKRYKRREMNKTMREVSDRVQLRIASR